MRRLTYRQANEIVNRFANALLARGLRRGDRVLLICENSVEAYLAKLATAKAGLVVVPRQPLARPGRARAPGRAGRDPGWWSLDAELWPQASGALTAAGLRPDVSIPIGADVISGGVSF